MRTQHHTKTLLKPHFQSSSEILDIEEMEDLTQFQYSHGLNDYVDQLQGHHTPYDMEDDAQEFYDRIMNRDTDKEL